MRYSNPVNANAVTRNGGAIARYTGFTETWATVIDRAADIPPVAQA